MKKIIAIFFLIIFTTSAIHANELLKLPKLFTHYQNHLADDRSLSFTDFIAAHYLSGNIMDDDYPQDMQLPFKTMHCTAGIVLNTPEPFISCIKPLSYPSLHKFFPGPLSLYLTNFSPVIWQPPRV